MQFKSINTSNSSYYLNDVNNCSVPHYMSSASEFFVCYAYFAELNVVKTVLELLLIVAAVGFNVLCTYLILFKSISWSVFDQILIGHCFIQCITALIDVPFFHMQDIFGYWPLPKIFSYFWASYDNNINTTTNLNMLYMCWARYRSVAAPTTFKNEVLIKHPKIVLTSIWGIGLTIWTPITIRYNNLNFSSSLNYDPIYLQNIFNTLFWFVPLILILYYSIQIIWILNKRALKKLLLIKHAVGDTTAHTPHTVNTVNSTTMTSPPVVGGKRNFAKRLSVIVKKKAKKVKMPPQVRFLLIILIYWIQWFIPCVTALVNGLCNCVPSSISAPIYWLTYTVVLTDPLTILILNPNVKLCS